MATGTGLFAISIFFHRVYKLSILHWTKSQQCGVLIWLGSLIYVMKDCTICMAAEYNCHIKICMFYSFRTWTKHALNAFALFHATGSLHLFENFEQFNVYTHYSVFQWAVQSTEYSDFYVFCNVHCDIIMQHEPIKCALFKLILPPPNLWRLLHVLNCPENEPMRFETCRRCQKLKNWIKILVWKVCILLVHVA